MNWEEFKTEVIKLHQDFKFIDDGYKGVRLVVTRFKELDIAWYSRECIDCCNDFKSDFLTL